MWPDDIVVFINMQRIYFDTNGACVKSGIYIHACIYMPCIYIHVVVYVYMPWYIYTLDLPLSGRLIYGHVRVPGSLKCHVRN